MVSRRDFLVAGSATLAASALGVGCATDQRSAPPPSQPKTQPRARAARLSDIDHIVIFIQENRSFDHYFGARPGVLGFADPAMAKGAGAKSAWAQPFADHPDGYLLPWHLDSTTGNGQCTADPNHSWEAQHAALAGGGGNRGFASTMGAGSLGYHHREDLPYYWAMADEFTLCDHSFCSVLGPTNPNRYMAWTGSIDAGNRYGGPVTSNVIDRAFTWPTYPERLQAAGVSWRVYHEVDDYDDNSLKYFKRFQGLAKTDPLYDAVVRNRRADAFAADAAAGHLPQVSWLVAPTAESEHPPYPLAVGHDYVSKQVAAVMSNPKAWAKTLFILTFDENGGFSDHVRPPLPPPGTKDEWVNGQPVGLGFRVPTLLLSPWTRSASGGRVVSEVFDHTSTLQLLERRFGVEVPNLSAWRRETCGDLSEALDFGHTDVSVPALPDTAARVQAVIEDCRKYPEAQPPATQIAPKTQAT